MNADLVFSPTGQPSGFSTDAMARWDGKPEPIVRELLQNCLDAARKAKRDRAEVWFTIAERPLTDLPGIDAYRAAFVEVCEQRRYEQMQSESEKRTIDRINSVLDRKNVRLLLCRDNGHGFDTDGLSLVLAEGNTDKDVGGGTTGVGHLTAFAGSDLRYVLYAGRSRSKGTLCDAFSGHAILASRKPDDNSNMGKSANGYLFRAGEKQLTLFSQGEKFPNRFPRFLEKEMKKVENTGSVVCITGFNNFRDKPENVVGLLQYETAVHFLAAVVQNQMIIHIHDDAGENSIIDHISLENILARDKDKKNRRKGVKGPSGQQAWRAWRVFASGERLTFSGVDGCTVWFRLRGESEGNDSSRVQLYRDGMWITNVAPHLEPPDFGSSKPFDAVVLLEDGELYKLVRAAEGPEHLGLDSKRLGNDWQRLRGLLAIVGKRLRETAGERERGDPYTPPDFATFTGEMLQAAESVPRYRPRRGVAREEESTVPGSATDGESPEDRDGEESQRGRPRRLSPRPGEGVPIRSSVLPERNAKGAFDTLRVVWRLNGRGRVPDMVGVRVRVPSGSDSTCENHLPPRWLELEAIQHPGGTAYASGRGATELAVPPADGTLTIMLTEPITDPNAVEVDVVRRKRESGNDG